MQLDAFFGLDDFRDNKNTNQKSQKKKITFFDALNALKNWFYSDTTDDFSEEFLKVLPYNTLITLLHKNTHILPILNEYLNNYSHQVDKQELVKFLKFIVKTYCISTGNIQPLFKKQELKFEGKKLDFIKPFEYNLVAKYLHNVDYKNIKQELKKNRSSIKKISFHSIIRKYKNIKKVRPECQTCGLRHGIQVLFDCNCKSDITKTNILFVAEAPGETETIEGIPLIGKAGQQLRPFIGKFFHNYFWFMTNVCLCRPEKNRTPTVEEKIACAQILDEVIEATDPDIIVALGGTAINRFNIDISPGVTKLRRNIFKYKTINGKEYKVFCTVHPSYILRNHDPSIYEEDFSFLKNAISSEKNMSLKDHKKSSKIYSIKLREDLYTKDLVDIQEYKNQMIYITRNSDGRKEFFKVSKDRNTYYYYTTKENDKFILNVDETFFMKSQPPTINTPGITLYESTVPPIMRHTVDYYYNRQIENKYTPRICFLDIEVATKNREFPDPAEAKYPVSMISMRFTNGYKVSLVNKKQTEDISNLNGYDIFFCENEKQLFLSFFKIFRDQDVDIVTAWNVSFDMGYLINRCERKVKLSFSNFSPLNLRPEIDLSRDYIYVPGLIIIDLLSAYRSLTYGDRESYSLGFIAELELEEKKLEKGSDFGKIFKNNIKRAISYNIDDVEKIYKIDKKLGIIDYLNELRNVASIPWKDVLITSKIVEGNLLSFCKKSNLVLRSKYPHAESKLTKVGAYVKTPIPGIHDNVYLVDFKSLYPSIMMTFNIGLDTFLAKFENLWNDVVDFINNKNRNYKLIIDPHLTPTEKEMTLSEVKEYLSDKILTPYGTIFESHKNHISLTYRTLGYLLEQRAHYRKLIKEDPDRKTEYNNKQRSYKEIANSNYGYYGFEGSIIYNIDVVNSVTVTGQYLIKLSARCANLYLDKKDIDVSNITNEIFNKWWMRLIPHEKKKDKLTFEIKDIDLENIIYTDTDSIYMQIGNNKKECEKIGDKAFGFVNEEIFKKEIVPIFNTNPEYTHLFLEYEATCRGYWPGEKKRYAYLDLNSGNIVIKGLETQRSDYPRLTRQRLKTLVEMILKGNRETLLEDIECYVKKVYDDFKQRIENLDTTICKPVSFSTQQYKKVPSHVIGMKLWNILQGREDFRPGTKGYQFLIIFDIDRISNLELKDKINKMLHECGFKGKINNIAVPEDFPQKELKLFFEKFGVASFLGGSIFKINVDGMLDFIWVQRCINLLKGILDVSYMFGRNKNDKHLESQMNLFNF